MISRRPKASGGSFPDASAQDRPQEADEKITTPAARAENKTIWSPQRVHLGHNKVAGTIVEFLVIIGFVLVIQ